MEPVKDHEQYGTVEEVHDPCSPSAARQGFPQGCIRVLWFDGINPFHLLRPQDLQQEDVLIFVRRK